MVPRKKSFDYSLYFYGLKQDPLGRGHWGSWDLCLNKLGKRLLGNATYHISKIWGKWFCCRKFFSIYILWLKNHDLCGGAILDPGTFTWTNLIQVSQVDTASYHISCTWGKWFWRRSFLNIFLCICMVQAQDLMGRRHFSPRGHHLQKQKTW